MLLLWAIRVLCVGVWAGLGFWAHRLLSESSELGSLEATGAVHAPVEAALSEGDSIRVLVATGQVERNAGLMERISAGVGSLELWFWLTAGSQEKQQKYQAYRIMAEYPIISEIVFFNDFLKQEANTVQQSLSDLEISFTAFKFVVLHGSASASVAGILEQVIQSMGEFGLVSNQPIPNTQLYQNTRTLTLDKQEQCLQLFQQALSLSPAQPSPSLQPLLLLEGAPPAFLPHPSHLLQQLSALRPLLPTPPLLHIPYTLSAPILTLLIMTYYAKMQPSICTHLPLQGLTRNLAVNDLGGFRAGCEGEGVLLVTAEQLVGSMDEIRVKIVREGIPVVVVTAGQEKQAIEKLVHEFNVTNLDKGSQDRAGKYSIYFLTKVQPKKMEPEAAQAQYPYVIKQRADLPFRPTWYGSQDYTHIECMPSIYQQFFQQEPTKYADLISHLSKENKLKSVLMCVDNKELFIALGRSPAVEGFHFCQDDMALVPRYTTIATLNDFPSKLLPAQAPHPGLLSIFSTQPHVQFLGGVSPAAIQWIIWGSDCSEGVLLSSFSMLTRDVPLAGKTISIEQDLSLSHAGTVWDGALVLAYYLHKNPHIVQLCVESRVVLELGSGTGVLGLAAALFRPRAVFLSDLPEFLNILHANRARNDQNWSPAQTRVQVVPLVWGNLESMSPLPHIDTIIGSQLAYDAQNIGYLIDTLIFYAKRNPKTSMLIAYQKYPQPARNLRNRLEQAGCFTMHEVDWEEMDAQYRDESIGILRIAINE